MPAVAHAFETISTAKVGRSAAECRDFGYFRKSDEIVMNHERLLAAAKAKALALAKDYKPPLASEFHLPGPSGKVALMLAVDVFVQQGKATAYDRAVAEGLADVLTGGPTADQTVVTTEDKITELERKTITLLLRQPPTLARMEYTLDHGKPLRN
jgi:3-hydroxyacyl-CoA dehydrogenase